MPLYNINPTDIVIPREHSNSICSLHTTYMWPTRALINVKNKTDTEGYTALMLFLINYPYINNTFHKYNYNLNAQITQIDLNLHTKLIFFSEVNM